MANFVFAVPFVQEHFINQVCLVKEKLSFNNQQKNQLYFDQAFRNFLEFLQYALMLDLLNA